MPTLTGIHHVDFTVTDIERSVPWYSEVFGLTKIMDEQHHPAGPGYSVVLLHPEGGFCIGLSVRETNEGERFEEHRTGLDHTSFSVADRGELEAWKARLDSPTRVAAGFFVRLHLASSDGRGDRSRLVFGCPWAAGKE